MSSFMVDSHILGDIIYRILVPPMLWINIFMKLNQWLESVFCNVEMKPDDLNALFLSLSDPKGGCATAFDFEDLGEVVDWQVFTYIFFRSSIKLISSKIDLSSPEAFWQAISDDSYIKLFLANEKASAQLQHVAGAIMKLAEKKGFINSAKDATIRAADAIQIKDFPLDMLTSLKNQGTHWQIVADDMLEKVIQFGLDSYATHNPRDLDCTIPSSLMVLRNSKSTHPFIGFSKTPRMQYSAGGGGAGNAFYAGIASLSLKSDGRIYTFMDYFADETLSKLLQQTCIPDAALSKLKDACNSPKADIAPDYIDHRLKQVYWIDGDKTVLHTPLIASSLQFDLNQLSEDDSIDFGKRRDALTYVKRMLSNFQNGSIMTSTTRGRHHLLKCLPSAKAPDYYFKFYQITEGQFVGYIKKKPMESLSRLITTQYRNENIVSSINELKVSIAADVASNLLITREFVVKQGIDWVNAKGCKHEHFPLFMQYAFEEKTETLCQQLADLALSQVSSEHLSDQVIAKLRPHVIEKLMENQ